MKSLLPILFLVLFAYVASAQTLGGYAALPKDSATQKVVYSGVVQVAGASKGDLFNRANEWGARSFADSKSANRLADKDAGSLIYQATIPANGTAFRFTLAVYVKDGRYKYIFNDFTDKPTTSGALETPVERWEKFASRGWAVKRSDELNAKVHVLLADLQLAMAGKSPASKDF